MRYFVFTCFLFLSTLSFSQKSCSISNNTFKSGEQLSYKIYYNWGAIWMNAGEASFNTYKTKIHNIDCFHFVGLGATFPKYDWFYRVRDRYESYVDTLNLKPIRFKREVFEGTSYAYDDYVFDHTKNIIYTSSKRNKKASKLDSIKMNSCTNDVMTAIYYARCIDFSKYKPNDTIPIILALDGEVFNTYIRYVGKETIESEKLGKVRCIKFKPKLIEGTIFKGGEGMTVWVTDDKNKIPVYVETPIIVGTVKVKLNNFTNLLHPIECIEKSKAP